MKEALARPEPWISSAEFFLFFPQQQLMSSVFGLRKRILQMYRDSVMVSFLCIFLASLCTVSTRCLQIPLNMMYPDPSSHLISIIALAPLRLLATITKSPT